MKLKITLLALTALFQIGMKAQENAGPTSIQKATKVTIVPSIASREKLNPAPKNLGEAKDEKSGKNIVVYGKGLPQGNDELLKNNNLSQTIKSRTPSLVFDAADSNSEPSDPAGAVGLNHYVLVFNTGFRIFDKLGNPLTEQLDTNNIFPVNGCCDLTCSYDTQANRYVMTLLGDGVQVAVSQTSDPLNGGWYVYDFPMNTDYQKLSIWSDGYYLTNNKNSGSADTSEVVYALERSKMLLGDPNAQIIGFPLPGIVTSGFYSPQAFNVSSSNFPAPGNVPIVYMQDDAWSGVTQDNIRLWTINVNWTSPASSTISAGQTIVTTPFTSVFDGGSFSNLPQPLGGTLIDALQATIMNQAQFRKFPSHNSAIFNFVIDVDGSSEKLAGVRWYELRQDADGQPWSIYQEGTYTSPDGKHAWMAGMCMDIQGNIGMGYSGMGGINGKPVSAYYTGRYANDPLGVMTIQENLIAQGNANIPGFRYGDYSNLAIDPVDDKTFWFVDEYMHNGRKNVVGVFKIAPNYNNDLGVVNIINPSNGTLTNTETVTVSIFNYGQNAASNFPVSFQLDSGAIITETFTGTIASSETAQYTFAATANLGTLGQTYAIRSYTSLFEDEDNANNQTIKNVTHLQPKDIGVSAIVTPVSGSSLTAIENITVTITNYGGQPQTNFPISYTLDGTTVNATYTGIVAVNSTVNYIFTQTGNLSALGNHTLTCFTNLTGDSNNNNDSLTTIINKINCQPTLNCNLGDGLRLFQIVSINNPSDCGTDGYNDFTNLSTNLIQNSTNDLTLTTEYGNQFVSVWIDFNDDFVFTNTEKVVDNYEIANGQSAGNYTESTTLVIPTNATLGEHLMRAKTNWNDEVSDDACQESTYGETEDYTANIVSSLATANFSLNNSELNIIYHSNNLFDISLDKTNNTEPLIFTVYNTVGQRLVYYQIENKKGSYKYELDMSYASSGVYLVRIGNNQFGKVKKIIVK